MDLKKTDCFKSLRNSHYDITLLMTMQEHRSVLTTQNFNVQCVNINRLVKNNVVRSINIQEMRIHLREFTQTEQEIFFTASFQEFLFVSV